MEELHKPARKNFPRRRIIIKNLDDLWQADLAEFTQYSRDNRNHKYILVVIDCYSKYLWTRPLKSKSGLELSNALSSIFKEGRIPSNLQTDQGKEFYNKDFQTLMNKHSINHYSTYSVIKAAIAERVIRTLKSMLYKSFSLRGKYKWIDVLPQITADYNNKKHTTIGMKPKDVSASTHLKVYNNIKYMGVGDLCSFWSKVYSHLQIN